MFFAVAGRALFVMFHIDLNLGFGTQYIYCRNVHASALMCYVKKILFTSVERYQVIVYYRYTV